MNKPLLTSLLLIAATLPAAQAGGAADPLLGKLMVDEFERRSDQQHSAIAVQGWLGYDRHKVWIKAEREASGASTQQAELQLLYSRAVAPFWDLQSGLRREWHDADHSDSWVLGLQGLAPFQLEIEASLYIDSHAQLSAEVDINYELQLSQQWLLEPNITLQLAAQHDAGYGGGLRDWQSGLRLYYYPRREWAPYIGLLWQQYFGRTADYVQQRGGSRQSEQLVLGLRAWF